MPVATDLSGPSRRTTGGVPPRQSDDCGWGTIAQPLPSLANAIARRFRHRMDFRSPRIPPVFVAGEGAAVDPAALASILRTRQGARGVRPGRRQYCRKGNGDYEARLVAAGASGWRLMAMGARPRFPNVSNSPLRSCRALPARRPIEARGAGMPPLSRRNYSAACACWRSLREARAEPAAPSNAVAATQSSREPAGPLPVEGSVVEFSLEGGAGQALASRQTPPGPLDASGQHVRSPQRGACGSQRQPSAA